MGTDCGARALILTDIRHAAAQAQDANQHNSSRRLRRVRRRDLLRHGALLPLTAVPLLRPLTLAAADAPAASGATPGTA
jgi:hypothetical protein